jgi:hypothetical protein
LPGNLTHGQGVVTLDKITSTEIHGDGTERNNHLTKLRPDLMQNDDTDPEQGEEMTKGTKTGKQSKQLAKCVTVKYCVLHPDTVLHSNSFIATLLTFMANAACEQKDIHGQIEFATSLKIILRDVYRTRMGQDRMGAEHDAYEAVFRAMAGLVPGIFEFHINEGRGTVFTVIQATLGIPTSDKAPRNRGGAVIPPVKLKRCRESGRFDALETTIIDPLDPCWIS